MGVKHKSNCSIMHSMQSNKQTNQQIKMKMIKQKVICMCSSNSTQSEEFDEVICCFCKNLENIVIFLKYFILLNMDIVSMFTAQFLHFFEKLILKSHRRIAVSGSSGEPLTMGAYRRRVYI